VNAWEVCSSTIIEKRLNNEFLDHTRSVCSWYRTALTNGAKSGRFLETPAEIWYQTSVEEETIAQEITDLHNEDVVDGDRNLFCAF
jgi:hypothetical protein